MRQRAFLVGLALASLACGALAQAWPARPVRIVVPGTPGSVTDLLARGMAESIRAQIGQPIVVENKPGANQMIAAEACSNARPDGYTFCITAPEPHANNLLLFKKLPYDPLKGFAPVAQLTTHTALIMANASVGANSIEEFAAKSRARAEGLNWASFGENSIAHVYWEGLRGKTGWNVAHVPYKTSLEARVALLSNEGQIAFLLADGAVKEQIDAGKLVPLVFAGNRRSPQYPNVPTLAEIGLKDIYIPGWFGVFAPAGTPDVVVTRMNGVVLQAMRSAPVQLILPAIGNAKADDNTPAEFAAVVNQTRDAARVALKGLNIQPQ